jgi:hypothetical protein
MRGEAGGETVIDEQELAVIEARAASGCSVVECWEELDDWYIACKEDVPALTAALREAWASGQGVAAHLQEELDCANYRILELEGAMARYSAIADAAKEWKRLDELQLLSPSEQWRMRRSMRDAVEELQSAECAAKQEALDANHS